MNRKVDLLVRYRNDGDVEAFHRFTDRNPCVQANALAAARDLSALRRTFGPSGDRRGADLRPVGKSPGESHPRAGILARAVEMPDAARSFVSDFAGGHGGYMKMSIWILAAMSYLIPHSTGDTCHGSLNAYKVQPTSFR
uniref:Uncharacterized protein n=1 Tax=Candidatus Kentrum sp. TC TaxID=2126339 RepID=A0A451AFW5_9GAMM|nr:MAG: hypothetical protein BECKTC1821F_GA0114240_11533 [Candidatus Kentron sp. TC]